MVKRLRLRPFTAATRVRFPSGSPPFSPISPIWRHSSAGRASASHAEGHRFEFCCLHQKKATSMTWLFSFSPPFSTAPGGRPLPTGQVTDPSSVVSTRKKPRHRRGFFLFLRRSAQHPAGDPLQRVRRTFKVCSLHPKHFPGGNFPHSLQEPWLFSNITGLFFVFKQKKQHFSPARSIFYIFLPF